RPAAVGSAGRKNCSYGSMPCCPASSIGRWPNNCPSLNATPVTFHQGRQTPAQALRRNRHCPARSRPKRNLDMSFSLNSATSCAIALLLGSSCVAAADDALIPIQQQWAVCQYQQTGKAKESC